LKTLLFYMYSGNLMKLLTSKKNESLTTERRFTCNSKQLKEGLFVKRHHSYIGSLVTVETIKGGPLH
jgi:hypothetical protein